MLKKTILLSVLSVCLYFSQTYAQEENLKSLDLMEKATEYYFSNKLDKSLEYVTLAIQLDPKNVEAYRLLAEIYKSTEPTYKVVEVLNKLIEINPNDFKAYHDLYWAYSIEEDYEKAKMYFEKTIEINPQYMIAYKDMINHYALTEENYIEAIVILEKVIELEPNNSEHYVYKSFYLTKIGEYTKALECAEKALEMDSDYAPAYTQMANIYYELDIFTEESLLYINKAIELDKKRNFLDSYGYSELFIYKHFLKGKILLKLGKEEEAKKEFEYVRINSSFMKYFYKAKKELELLS